MNRKVLRAVCCLLCAMMLLPCLNSCKTESEPGKVTGELTNTTEKPEESTAPATDEQTPDPDAITVDDLKELKIIYPMKAIAFEEEAKHIQTAIKIRYGVTVPIGTDVIREGSETFKEYPYEILIGETNRQESAAALNDLLILDSGYCQVGKKIVVKGGSDDATSEAVSHFASDIVMDKKGGKTVFFQPAFQQTYLADYPARGVKLNGTDISSYAVVYPANSNLFEKQLADRLVVQLVDLCGVRLECRSDAVPYAGGYEILIGKTNRKAAASSEASVEGADKFVILNGSRAYDLGLAQNQLLSLMEAGNGEQGYNVNLTAPVAAQDRDTVSLMSYNIYGFNVTDTRVGNVCSLISKYLPGIIALQEPAKNFMDLTANHLGEYYGILLGKPRHGEGGQDDNTAANSYAPILYAKDRYEVISWETKWMTDTPDTVSKQPEADHYRIYTAAVMRDLRTGERFLVVNVHMSYTSDAVRFAELKTLFRSLNASYTDLPVFVMGDMNCNSSSQTYRLMTEVAGFGSVDTMAEETEVDAFGIDFIFATPDCVSAQRFVIVNEKVGGSMPSDHPAVYAEVTLSGKSSDIEHDWSDTLRYILSNNS